ncbi:MAG: putative ABC transport system permease protein [Sphingobacteriales bacterium]
MDLLQHIKMALIAIKGNLLRTTLTALIISIGIMALVGILTSIDGLKKSIKDNFSNMGANSFTILKNSNVRVNSAGKSFKRNPTIKLSEAMAFKERFGFPSKVAVSFNAAFTSIAKYGSIKTNPNITIIGSDENYLQTAGYEVEIGRNFLYSEALIGNNVVLIGKELQTLLFKNEDPIDKLITLGNQKFVVIGVLKEKGSSFSFGGDRLAIVPIPKARQITQIGDPSFVLNVGVNSVEQMEVGIGEATALLRQIRKLDLSQEDNFEITKSDMLSTLVFDNIKFVTLAATLIGFITLLGASIGLMNIMMVSVTERTREIGIRKAIGATANTIRKQFLIEAVVICLIGGLLGVFLGILIGNLVTYFTGAGFIIPWLWIVGGLLLSYLVGIASGLYPAIKASKLDPVEALRYE